MTTDRELLELAARAAGYKYKSANECIVIDGIPGRWNPVLDDGDALRLAVQLNFTVDVQDDQKCVEVRSYDFLPMQEPFAGDRFVATRCAIVRAAAEIGRAMP
jgi:hypothetical protein